MHVLVSFCNLKAKGCPSLGLLNVDTFEFNVLALPEGAARNGGLTGLAASDQYIFVVAQSLADGAENAGPVSTLLVFERKNFALCGRHEFQTATDVHSLWVSGSHLLAVSTGTDEVVELSLRGPRVASERIIWRPDSAGTRENYHHLNAIYGWDEGILVSGFGKKAADTWDTARDGFIANITTGEYLVSGIDQPHSVLRLSTGMVWCESRKAALRLLHDEGEEVLARLPGYTRGLCTVGKWLFAGTSVGRKHSRSTGQVNNPAEMGIPDGRCTVTRLSLATLEPECTIDLGSHAQEVYDLLPVEETGGWPVEPEVRWRDTAIRTLVEVLDARTTWAKQTSAALTRCEADLSAAQDQLAAQESTRKEIEELRSLILKQSDQLDASMKAFAELQARLGGAEAELGFLRDVALTAFERWAPELVQKLRYRQQILRIRAAVEKCVPVGGIVAVISKGDKELLRLGGREAWHFPQNEHGDYAGYYPASSLAAIAHLELLRARGARFLVVPATASWWLDSYPDFKRHLENRYRLVASQAETGSLYALSSPATREACSLTPEQLLARLRSVYGREPSVLDWNTGQKLAGCFPGSMVFSPPMSNGRLPYVDSSIDVVAIASRADDTVVEARRVAGAAVLDYSGPEPAALWLRDLPEPALPTASIVMPVFNNWRHTAACLSALRDTLSEEFRGEILVVDDASTDETPQQLKSLSRQDGRIQVLRNDINRGFLDSCNRGAEGAAGEFLVFLNNDTVTLPGWLPPLLRTFEQFPDAGAVGGKLLFPDGRLQEAGGIVFRDASAAHFGRGEPDSTVPLFNYVRAVDYCSGALLATRRSLFGNLGGFDEEFQPGYYEDTDYCFRVREQRLQVYYQPESVVVHLEGGTSGTDPLAGMKQYQAVNLRRFLGRWRKVLDEHPPRPTQFDQEAWYALAQRTWGLVKL